MLKFQRLLVLAFVCVSGVASAERWQERANNGRMKVRIDLDGFQRDGNLLTYRVEITYPKDPKRSGQSVISTSVIEPRLRVCPQKISRMPLISTTGPLT